MANVTITFDGNYTKKNGDRTLYAVIWLNSRKVKFHTGVCVKTYEFNDEKKEVRSSRADHKDLNLILQSTLARINDIKVRYRLQHETLTPEILKKEFKNSAARVDFHLFLQEAIRERIGELSPNTIKQHYSMANKLKAFYPVLKFTQMDEEFMVKFNRWLQNHKKNGTNTRFNNLKNLKSYINIAVRKRIVNFNPLNSGLPVKRADTIKEFLTENEVYDLVKLYDRQYLPESLQKVLRHFLFMCFTGLRISDLKALTMEQIVGDMLIYTAIKTKNQKNSIIKVPICSTAKRLIRDEAPHRLQGRIFITFSEQMMRKKIKDIVKVIGIEKNISLHTARHTFATMFLRNSKNLAVLQRLLGHSKIEQTMIYAHLLTEDIERELHSAFARFS